MGCGWFAARIDHASAGPGHSFSAGAAGGCGSILGRAAVETRACNTGPGCPHGPGGLAFPEALPERTRYDIYSTGGRPTRRGLSDPSIKDRGRVRWILG